MNEKQLEQFIIMQNDINNIKKDVQETKELLQEFIKTAEQRYANKWAETAWIWLLRAISLAVIGMVSYAVFHSYTVIK